MSSVYKEDRVQLIPWKSPPKSILKKLDAFTRSLPIDEREKWKGVWAEAYRSRNRELQIGEGKASRHTNVPQERAQLHALGDLVITNPPSSTEIKPHPRTPRSATHNAIPTQISPNSKNLFLLNKIKTK